MRSEVHLLRLPRLAAGIVQRCRETEKVAIWDEVPVALPAFSAGEAPVAFHRRRGNPGIRVVDGVAYDDDLAAPGQSPAQAWEGIVRDVEPLVLHRLNMAPHAKGSIYDGLLPWSRVLEGASRKRGITRTDEIAFRDVFDDGRASQAELARGLAGRLAVIDGRLALRGGLPRLSVTRWSSQVEIFGGMATLDWDDDPEWGRPWGPGCFRIDRDDDAHAYARALAARTGLAFAPPDTDGGPVIVDAEAVDRCYARIAAEDALAMVGVANGVAEALRPALPVLPDAEIARYLEVRALGRARDGAGIRRWVERLPGTRDALAAAAPAYPNGQPSPLAKHVDELDAVILRLETVDDPRMRMAADEGSLAALGPGR